MTDIARIWRLSILLLTACSGSGPDSGVIECGPNGECPAGTLCETTTRICIQMGPVILDTPVDQEAMAPAPATFAVTAAGALNYQWQLSADGGVTFANVAGALGPSYTIMPTSFAEDGLRVRVRVSNGDGVTTSSSAQLTVRALVNIKGFGPDGQGVVSYPGDPLPPLVTMDLPAGSYRLSDAWRQPGALYDAWNYQSSVAHGTWGWAYLVYAMTATGGFEVLLNVRGPWVLGDCLYCFFDSEEEASLAAETYPPSQLSLTEPTTLVFAVPDYALGDDLGGVSLLISRIAP